MSKKKAPSRLVLDEESFRRSHERGRRSERLTIKIRPAGDRRGSWPHVAALPDAGGYVTLGTRTDKGADDEI